MPEHFHLLSRPEPAEEGSRLTRDPMSYLLWTNKSTRNLAAELARQGYTVSHVTVARSLRELGYSLQANVKMIEGTQHPDRGAQFRYLNDQVRRAKPKLDRNGDSDHGNHRNRQHRSALEERSTFHAFDGTTPTCNPPHSSSCVFCNGPKPNGNSLDFRSSILAPKCHSTLGNNPKFSFSHLNKRSKQSQVDVLQERERNCYA